MELTAEPLPLSPDDRFDELPRGFRVRIRRWDHFGDHWVWFGGTSRTSERAAKSSTYGQFTFRQGGRASRKVYVHRFVYECLVGPIPHGFVIDHLCGESLCCRPSHLEAVTLAENTRRGGPGSAARAKSGLPEQLRPLDLGPLTGWVQPTLWEDR